MPEAAQEFVMGDLATKADLQAAMDTLSLRLTLWLGVMLAAGLATLAAIIKL